MGLRREDREWVAGRALAAGFDLAEMAAVPEAGSEAAGLLAERYGAWIAQGRAGGMDYLKRVDADGQLVRGDVRRAFPWARSVLVAAVEYGPAGAPRSIDLAPEGRGWIARYAWSGDGSSGQRAADSGQGAAGGFEVAVPAGSDYHDVLLARLKAIESEIRARFEGVETRCYVDTGPLVERAVAAWAGVGWVGKNTCLISPERGSFLLLGVVVTSLELEPEAWTLPMPDRCGTCTRCIEACPTEALVGAREMDASRCIAYLTIEHKGAIAEELREGMGRQVFGCDICQEVCPWNAKRARTREGDGNAMPSRDELINPELGWLAAMENPEFKRWFRGAPLERTGKKRLRRNVAIAMGNSGETRFVPQLEAWAEGEDEVLAEAAVWALGRVRRRVGEEQE